MPKRKRQNKYDALPWEKVDIRSLTGKHEIDVDSGKHIGMFYGLEVVSGDKFKWDGENTVVVADDATTKSVDNDDKGEEGDSSETIDVVKEVETEKQDSKEEPLSKEEPKKEKDDSIKEYSPDDQNTTSSTTTKKKKKKKKSKPTPTHSLAPLAPPTPQLLSQTAHNWQTHCAGLQLHPTLLNNLASIQFLNPTPIQAATLPPALYGRRDIIGAAPTGSGKTLAFGLPLLQRLLEEKDEAEKNGNQDTPRGIRALVLSPTRELSVQIGNELQRISGKTIPVGTVVGGLSEEKQKRILKQLEGGVLVGTVGRLWDLMSSQLYESLNALPKTCRFLVIDEVDRMVTSSERGVHVVFPQLDLILEFLKHEDMSQRQTFIFSATLTLHGQECLPALLQQTGSTNIIKTIDLTVPQDTTSKVTAAEAQRARLPPNLALKQVKCTQHHKDSHLYAALTTVIDPGPILIFCNSISGAKRVWRTLQMLLGEGRVKLLFGDMAQKQRLKAIEAMKSPDSQTILVATDVAARGIDIPFVSTIVHYDVPRTVETFIHRSGRTARGMGDHVKGTSVSLIAPAEEKKHLQIKDLFSFDNLIIDGRILQKSQHRAALATQIIKWEEIRSKQNSEQEWYKKAAKESDLQMDDNLLQETQHAPQKMTKKEVGFLKAQLAHLLSEPLRAQQFGKFMVSNLKDARERLMKQERMEGFCVPKSEVGRKKKRRKKR